MSKAKTSEVLLIDCGSRRVPDLSRILTAGGAKVRIAPLASMPDELMSSADGIVISGGPTLFTESAGVNLVKSFRFLDDLTVPVLGICLGHQAIACYYGGVAFRGPARRETETIEVIEDHLLLDGLPPRLSMCADHCEGVGAPSSFRSIARSEQYPNEMMISKTRPMFGVQFHPEASGESGERLLLNFLSLVRAHSAQTA